MQSVSGQYHNSLAARARLVVASATRPPSSPNTSRSTPDRGRAQNRVSSPALAESSLDGSVISSELNLNGVKHNNLERLLNIGALSTVGMLGLATLFHAGENPWLAYQHAVAVNPIETKACISGVVYSLGDLIAQSYEGRDIAEWDRGRVIRSGLCGLLAHGPLSHLYYVGLDHVFAQQNFIAASWMVPAAKVAIDQTAWSLFWNSTYYTLLGILKFESADVIAATVRNSWWDLLKAGWRMWPLVHLLTYGVVPVQHRLLFVDAVELVWVCILSLYAQKSRENSTEDWVACALPGADGEGGDAAEEILRGLEVQNEIVLETATGERVVLAPSDVYKSG
jgi:hypothetical protein